MLRCWESSKVAVISESEEELKNFLIRVKEESEKAGLKFNIRNTRIMTSDPITSLQIDGEKVATATDFIFSLLPYPEHLVSGESLEVLGELKTEGIHLA